MSALSPVPEFSRRFDIRQADGRTERLSARPAEREALARRFGLVRIDRLEAELVVTRTGEVVDAAGTLCADIVQSCAVSAEDLPAVIREQVAFRFVPARADLAPDAEIELGEADLDEIEYDGTAFDLGEAVAQSLSIAIDPFATGPEAEAARALLRDEADNPFAALKGKFKD